MSSLDAEKKKRIDSTYFKLLKDFPIDVLGSVRPIVSDAEYKNFVSEEIESPQLGYRPIDLQLLATKRRGLKNLLNQIQCDDGFPEDAKTLYTSSLTERQCLLDLIEASQNMLNGNDSSANTFANVSSKVYGAPSVDMFASVLGKVLNKTADKDADNNNVIDAKVSLRELIDSSVVIPTQTAIRKGKSFPEGERIDDSKLVKNIFEESLSSFGLNDWVVEVDTLETDTNVTVFSKTKRISVPSNNQLRSLTGRQALTELKIKGLVAHEIQTHALRSQNGHDSQLQLLQFGLAGYILGEEGIATYREQQVTGKGGYAGLDAYFAAGLAAGLDRNEGRTFRELFEVLQNFYLISTVGDVDAANRSAWNRCIRIFRGTTGTIPGVYFTRDIVYREGSVRIHRFMETEMAQNIDLNIGKFDPVNQEHVTCLRGLGLL